MASQFITLFRKRVRGGGQDAGVPNTKADRQDSDQEELKKINERKRATIALRESRAAAAAAAALEPRPKGEDVETGRHTLVDKTNKSPSRRIPPTSSGRNSKLQVASAKVQEIEEKRIRREKSVVVEILSNYPGRTEAEVKDAAKVIQSYFRGYHFRKELTDLRRRRSRIAHSALEKVTNQVIDWIQGWHDVIMVSIYLTLLMVMIWYQLFNDTPRARDVNPSIIGFFAANGGDAVRENLLIPADVLDFVDSLLIRAHKVSRSAELFENNTNATCDALYRGWCDYSAATPDASDLSLPRDFTPAYRLALESCLLNKTQEDSGYLNSFDRFVFGFLVTQTRFATETCAGSTGLDPYRLLPSRPCVASDGALEDRYVSDVCPDGAHSASACAGGEFTYNDELEAFGTALDAGSMGFRLSDVLCRTNYLRQREWLDYRTQQVCVTLYFFNKNGNYRLGYSRDCFIFSIGGRVSFQRVAVSVSSLSSSTSAGLGLTVTFILFTAFIFVAELLAWRKREYRVRLPLDLFQLFVLGMSVACCALYFLLVQALSNTTLTPLSPSTVPLTNSSPAFVVQFSQIERVLSMWQAYLVVAAVEVIAVLARLLSLLDFHPSSAKISGTLRIARKDLLSFLIVFIVVLVCYGFVGVMLIGRSRPLYSDFSVMLNTLLFVAIGEVQEFKDDLFNDPPVPPSQQVVEGMYFWSYCALVTVLLFNVLLSIIVDAYVQLSEAAKGGDAFFSFLMSFTVFVRVSLASWGRVFTRALEWIEPRCPLCCRRRCRVRGNGTIGGGYASVMLTAGASKLPEKPGAAATENVSRDPLELLHELAFTTEVLDAIQIRAVLTGIIPSPRAVELMIMRMRTLTQIEAFDLKKRRLNGMAPQSAEIVGHQLYLLESILKWQKDHEEKGIGSSSLASSSLHPSGSRPGSAQRRSGRDESGVRIVEEEEDDEEVEKRLQAAAISEEVLLREERSVATGIFGASASLL